VGKKASNGAAFGLGSAVILGVALSLGAGPAAGPAASQETASQEVASQEEAGRPEEVMRLGAILQGLDKTTARVSTIEVPLGQPARFGTLQIVARACHKKPPTETPESTAFLEIVDIRPDSPAISVFIGWMFASSPSVSAMEHPVYDVWVIDCRLVATSEADTEAAPEAANSDLGEPRAE